MTDSATDLIAQYYRITDQTYLALSLEARFMNLGLWPARSISEAQANLVDTTLLKLKNATDGVNYDLIVEGGSGWGGSLRHVRKIFGETPYLGFNLSKAQIEYSTTSNRNFTNFLFIHDSIESIAWHDFNCPNIFFSIEAVIHLPDKKNVFRALRHANVQAIALAEITTDKIDLLLKEPLFYPSLGYLGSNDDYVGGLTAAGYEIIDNIEITNDVFASWAQHLCEVSDDDFTGSHRILNQLKSAYSKLAEYANDKIVEYRIYTARLRK